MCNIFPRWENRDRKRNKKKNFISDNRKSVQLISKLSLLPKKQKQNKKRSSRR
tara:strand:+ start:5110 stop:5268 length:159 start_codon:yes stop_codon:yes gene_type:complete